MTEESETKILFADLHPHDEVNLLAQHLTLDKAKDLFKYGR